MTRSAGHSWDPARLSHAPERPARYTRLPPTGDSVVTTLQHTDLSDSVRQHYPWPGADHTLSSGHRLHYLDEGSGETLLMVHGNPTWSFYWRTLVHGLSSDYRCVVPDHVGCGLSDKPKEFRARLIDHIDNLVELIDHLDLQDITLVVHDWGGAIGFGAALKRPERFKRLVVFNTAVFIMPVPLSIRLSRMPLIGEPAVLGINAFLRIGMFRALVDRSRYKGGVAEGYRAPYNSWENRRAMLKFIRDIPLEDGHPTRETIQWLDDNVASLSHLPTTFIWGMQDFVFTGAFLDNWLGRFPEAEVHKLEDAGHFVVEDGHERIVPIVRDFLGRHAL